MASSTLPWENDPIADENPWLKDPAEDLTEEEKRNLVSGVVGDFRFSEGQEAADKNPDYLAAKAEYETSVKDAGLGGSILSLLPFPTTDAANTQKAAYDKMVAAKKAAGGTELELSFDPNKLLGQSGMDQAVEAKQSFDAIDRSNKIKSLFKPEEYEALREDALKEDWNTNDKGYHVRSSGEFTFSPELLKNRPKLETALTEAKVPEDRKAEALSLFDQNAAQERAGTIELAKKTSTFQKFLALPENSGKSVEEAFSDFEKSKGWTDWVKSNVVSMPGQAAQFVSSQLAGAVLGAAAITEAKAGDPLSKVGRALNDWSSTFTPYDVRYSNTAGQTVAQVVPQTAIQLGLDAALKRAGLGEKGSQVAAQAFTAISSGVQIGAENYKSVFDANKDKYGEDRAHEMAMEAFKKSVPLGVSELLSLDVLLAKAPKGKVWAVAKNVASALSEVGTENYQNAMSNAINKKASASHVAAQTMSLADDLEMGAGTSLVELAVGGVHRHLRSQYEAQVKAEAEALRLKAQGVAAAGAPMTAQVLAETADKKEANASAEALKRAEEIMAEDTAEAPTTSEIPKSTESVETPAQQKEPTTEIKAPEMLPATEVTAPAEPAADGVTSAEQTVPETSSTSPVSEAPTAPELPGSPEANGEGSSLTETPQVSPAVETPVSSETEGGETQWPKENAKAESVKAEEAKSVEPAVTDSTGSAVQPEVATPPDAKAPTPSPVTASTGAKGIISDKPLPVNEVETEPGVKKVVPAFTNDPDTLAEQLHQNGGAERIYIPDEILDSEDPKDQIDNERIGYTFEKGTGKAYVTSATHSRYPDSPIGEDGKVVGSNETLADLYKNDENRKARSAAQTGDGTISIPEESPEYVQKIDNAPESVLEKTRPNEVAVVVRKIGEVAAKLASETVTTNDGGVASIGPELADRIGAAAANKYRARLRGVDKGRFLDPQGLVNDVKRDVLRQLKSKPGENSGVSLNAETGDGTNTVGDIVGGDSVTQGSLDERNTKSNEKTAEEITGATEEPAPATDYASMVNRSLSEAVAELSPEDAVIWGQVAERTLNTDAKGRRKKFTKDQQRVFDAVQKSAAEKLQAALAIETDLDPDTGEMSAAATPDTDPEIEATIKENIAELSRATGGNLADTKLSDILKFYHKDTRTHWWVRQIAGLLVKSPVDFSGVKLQIISNRSRATNWSGLYQGSTASGGTLSVNLAAGQLGGLAQTFVHEAVHHALVFKLRPGYPRTQFEREARADLIKILTHLRKNNVTRSAGETFGKASAKAAAADRDLYLLSDLDELVSELMSNPTSKEWLNGLPPIEGLSINKRRGFWKNLGEQLKAVFSKLLTGTYVRPDSLMGQALGNVFTLISTPQTDAAIKQYNERRNARLNETPTAAVKPTPANENTPSKPSIGFIYTDSRGGSNAAARGDASIYLVAEHAAGNNGGSQGTGTPDQQRREGLKSLIEYTKNAGLNIAAPFFRRLANPNTEFAKAGAEHSVYFDPRSNRVIKLSHDDMVGDGAIGSKGGAWEYFRSALLGNAVFGMDTQFEGLVNLGGASPQVVTSQTRVQGRKATNQEISDYMKSRHFVFVDGAWVNQRIGVKVSDVVPANVLRSADGRLHFIDVDVVPTKPINEILDQMGRDTQMAKQANDLKARAKAEGFKSFDAVPDATAVKWMEEWRAANPHPTPSTFGQKAAPAAMKPVASSPAQKRANKVPVKGRLFEDINPDLVARPGKLIGLRTPHIARSVPAYQRKTTTSLSRALFGASEEAQKILRKSTYISSTDKINDEAAQSWLNGIIGQKGATLEDAVTQLQAMGPDRFPALSPNQQTLAKAHIALRYGTLSEYLAKDIASSRNFEQAPLLDFYRNEHIRLLNEIQETGSTSGQDLQIFAKIAKIFQPFYAARAYADPFTETQKTQLDKTGAVEPMREALDAARKDGISATLDKAGGILSKVAKKLSGAVPPQAVDSVQLAFDFLNQIDRSLGTSGFPATVDISKKIAEGLVSRLKPKSANTKQVAALEQLYKEANTRVRGLIEPLLNPKVEGLTPEQKMKQGVERMIKDENIIGLVQQGFTEAQGALLNDPSVTLTPEARKALEEFTLDPAALLGAQTVVRNGLAIKDLIYRTVTEQGATVEDFIGKLVSDYGLTGPQAEAVGEAIRVTYSAEAKKAAASRLASLVKEKPKQIKIGRPEKLFRLINIGAFSEASFYNALAAQFNLPTYSEETAARLEKEARRIQTLPQDSDVRAEATIKLMGDIAEGARQSLAGFNKWKHILGDLAPAVWQASVLTGPPTHLVNYLSTLANIGLHSFTDAFGYSVASMKAGAPLSDVMKFYSDMFTAFHSAYAGKESVARLEALRALTTGTTRYKNAKMEDISLLERMATSPGKLDRMLSNYKWVGRIMLMTDAMNSGTAQEVKQRMALRYASTLEGKRGQDMEKAILDAFSLTQEVSDEINAQVEKEKAEGAFDGLENPAIAERIRREELFEQRRGADIIEQSRDTANRWTFNGDPKGMAGYVFDGLIGGMNRKLKVTKFLFPFMRTMGNLLDVSLDFTPGIGQLRAYNVRASRVLGEGNKYSAARIERGSPEFYAQQAKAWMGTMMFASVLAAAIKGLEDEEEGKAPAFAVYGAGPQDKYKRQQMQTAGWMPNSIKIGGRYLRYTDWPAINIALASIGTMSDFARDAKNDDAPIPTKIGLAMLGTTAALTEKTMLGGLSNLITVMANPDTRGLNALGRVVTSPVSGVTNPPLFQWLRNTLFMDGNSQVDVLDRSGFDGLMNSLVPFNIGAKTALNVLGEPLQNYWHAATTRRFGYFDSVKEHPMLTPLAKAGLFIPSPSKNTTIRINGRPKPMSLGRAGDDAWRAFLVYRGQALKEIVTPGMLANLAAAKDKDMAQAELDGPNVKGRATAIAQARVESDIQQGKIKIP